MWSRGRLIRERERAEIFGDVSQKITDQREERGREIATIVDAGRIKTD